MTKTEKRIRCRQLLQGSAGAVGLDDHIFLLDEVFLHHPDWAEKRGVGVDRIEVRKGFGAYKAPAFWIVRTDGSATDISYKTSLDGRRSEYEFVKAARYEVSVQTFSWKRDHPAPGPGMQLDHIEPFDAILRDWLKLIRLEPAEIVVTKQRVGHNVLFLSRELAISWQRFHKSRARYQWLSAAENASKSNRPPVVATDPWVTAYEAEEQRIEGSHV